MGRAWQGHGMGGKGSRKGGTHCLCPAGTRAPQPPEEITCRESVNTSVGVHLQYPPPLRDPRQAPALPSPISW